MAQIKPQMTQTKLIKLGLYIFKKSFEHKLKGFPRYSGSALKICETIVRDCWDGDFFCASNGHFKQFWVRDFSWIIDSLNALCLKQQVRISVENAFTVFKQQGIKTTIWKNIAFNAPKASIDSVALFIYSLHKTGSSLIKNNKRFISTAVNDLFSRFVNKDNGLALSFKSGSMKDHAIRQSSCYDNMMLFLIQNILRKYNIKTKLDEYNYYKIFHDNFWNGSFFEDDINTKHVSGDANIVPVFYGLVSKAKAIKAINAVIAQGLTEPLPLRYCSFKCNRMNLLNLLLPNYETTSVWTHLGAMFLKSCYNLRVPEFQEYMHKYESIIKHYGNYLEVFTVAKKPLSKNNLLKQLKPFKTLLYYSDHSMSWAAILWELLSKNQ